MKFNNPPPLEKGDLIQVISPSFPLDIISQNVISSAKNVFSQRGFEVVIKTTYSTKIEELHSAINDEKVKCIISSIGGNQAISLLDEIDYDLIIRKPKIFCGFSDFTFITSAITAKCRLKTFHGPHFSTFGVEKYNEYTIENFFKYISNPNNLEALKPSSYWSNDQWYLDQGNRTIQTSNTPEVLKRGDKAIQGHSFFYNLDTLLLLCNTQYLNKLDSAILGIDVAEDVSLEEFIQKLKSLSLKGVFDQINGLLFSKLPSRTNLKYNSEFILNIQSIFSENNFTIITNLDFGHTLPITTLQIGDYINLEKMTSSNIKFD